MRKRAGFFCMLTGLVMVVVALCMVWGNYRDAAEAKIQAENLMMDLRLELAQSIQPKETVPVLQDNTPDVLLQPEDLQMTECVVDGYPCIGYISVPVLGLELPVLSQWSYPYLKVSPCRYAGSLKGGNLVIMAHNYNSHFGQLSTLSEKDTVIFTDMDGISWQFQVAAIDVLSPEAVEEMTAGEYALTLFTCVPGGTHRVTIRCTGIIS